MSRGSRISVATPSSFVGTVKSKKGICFVGAASIEILDPRDTYADAAQWDEKAKDLAARFIKNFKKYETNEAGKALVAAGPQL